MPAPEGLPDWEDLRAVLLPDAPRMESPIEVRMLDPFSEAPSPPRQRNWMRVKGPLPDDPVLHAAVLVYATDRTLLSTAARAHGLPWGKRMAASLDHAVWIHHPIARDRFMLGQDWMLYASESPVAHDARGLITGGVYTRAGVRIASVAQEALIRLAR